jgi:glycerol-3-phosphate acyltransferase PlsY
MKILFALFSYLLGSFPTGYVLFSLSEKKDIRSFGSYSTGATNVLRLKGWIFALPVVLVDVLKGFLPVFLALRLFPDKKFALLCGFLAVLGHCFPVYIKFKGGKGVATAVGVFLALAVESLLICVAIFIFVILLTRFVSLGSLLAMLSLPIAIFIIQGDIEKTLLGFAVFLLIAIRHAGNIKRLIRGNERKLGEKVQ